MKKLQDLQLAPGEVVFLDSVRDGIARLVIGAEGDRVETVSVDELPVEDRNAGIYLIVQHDGSLKRDTEREKRVEEE
ncbi:MAG: hypothetical protein KY468_19055, partial [Armatimonadetes bacterium]|nr:hypothetical protein [Armatimonadota bacterium]